MRSSTPPELGCGESTISVAFEFCALEALLQTAATQFNKRQVELSEALRRALHTLRKSVIGTRVVAGSLQLDQVRELKQSVRELLVQSQALEEALREVLDEDEDMEAMYLTRRHLQQERAATWGVDEKPDHEHEEVEMLLESYLQEVTLTRTRTLSLTLTLTRSWRCCSSPTFRGWARPSPSSRCSPTTPYR